ncbi:MAG: GNAT family N-acetyltransferase [Bacteroidota bacterium]
MKAYIKNATKGVIRFLWSLRRPSKKENMRQLNVRGFMPDDFVVRLATVNDIPALSALHVQVWNETYWNVKRTPTLKTRQWQWAEQFKEPADDWFCYVIVNPDGELIGFAKGKKYASDDLPAYSGELNKIYLLLPYQRLGFGRRLVIKVAEHFINIGITTMVLFGEPHNPSIRFHEAIGGKRLYASNGEFHGGYGWDDLRRVAAL